MSCSSISPYPTHLMHHSAMAFGQRYQSMINTLQFPHLVNSIHARPTSSAMTGALHLDNHLPFCRLRRRFITRFRSISSHLGVLKRRLSSASIKHSPFGWLAYNEAPYKGRSGCGQAFYSRSCVYCLSMYATPYHRRDSGQIWCNKVNDWYLTKWFEDRISTLPSELVAGERIVPYSPKCL
jgi:hypothetical protein